MPNATKLKNMLNWRKLLLASLLLATLSVLAACSAPLDAKSVARTALDAENKQSVQITKVVAGNPKIVKADALWCIETDQKNADGSTLLMTVSRTGTSWTSNDMTDGEYEWDLNGCPR